jgi:hypothetical protein
MAIRSAQTTAEDAPTLSIPTDQVCWLVFKARKLHVKDVDTSDDPASNAIDDGMTGVLEDRPDDATGAELLGFIRSLSEDEQIDLVALMWLGRDGSSLAEWPGLRAEAARAHGGHARQTAEYLMGEPLVSDYIEEAMSMMGLSCSDDDEVV